MSVPVLKRHEAGARSAVGRKSMWVSLVILLSLVVVVLLPASPVLYKTPNNDSSIFLYIGREIIQGKLLYHDVYDHKPPLIFLLNAAGLILGGGGQWGVWALELISLAVALLLAFLVLERFFGRLPALVACGAMLVNLAFVHERGNLTEEYAYPFQFGALYLLVRAQQARRSFLHFIGIGILLGLASSLKQPLAGIGVAITVYLAFDTLTRPVRRWGDLLIALAWMAAGAGVVWLVWLAVFAAAGIFPEFWEAVFLMNFGVSGHSFAARLQALLEALRWLFGSSGFFLGGMLVWLTVLPFLILFDRRVLPFLSGRWMGVVIAGLSLLFLYNGLFREGLVLYRPADLSPYRFRLIIFGLLLAGLGGLFLAGWAAKRARSGAASFTQAGPSNLALPLIIALVDLPLSLGFAILTGRNFPHYFMPLMPSLTILLAYAVSLLLQDEAAPAGRLFARVWLVVLMLPVFWPGVQVTFKQLHPRGDRQIEDVAAYLKANTLPGEPVLQWGISPAVYVLSERSAPTRFFFANPLFFDGYSGEWHTSRLLADLQARPPVVIIDSQMIRLPLITAPLDTAGTGWQDCQQVKQPVYYHAFLEARRGPEDAIPQFPAGMGDVYQWICQNYRPAGAVGELNWQLYQLKGN